MEIQNVVMLFIAGLLICVFVAWLVTIFNSLIQLRKNIDKTWSNIDVLLKQRHDELTKLLPTVEKYMQFEQNILTRLTEARTSSMQAGTIPDKAKASDGISTTLKSLFAVAENYPDLKTNNSFVKLQSRISELEMEIADRREFFNDSVNTYNVRIHSIPDLFIAYFMSYKDMDLFHVSESDRQDVTIELKMN